MTTPTDVQRALVARGFDLGDGGPKGDGVDGRPGPRTYRAILDALNAIPLVQVDIKPKVSNPIEIVPAEWMPWAEMQRIIVHWTAGSYDVSSLDKEHYHLIIGGDCKLVRGDRTIRDNENARDGVYAAHTRGCNTGSIGVSVAAMAGAKESPFDAGKYPLREAQWEMLVAVCADLCRRYGIAANPTTLLSHAEVEPTLGIDQAGKWDITRLPWNDKIVGAIQVGDELRRLVNKKL